MRSFAFSLVLAFLGYTLSSCLFIGPSLKGNGKVKEEIREVGEFYGVNVTSGMNVYFVQGDHNKVVVVADENLHEYIETQVEDGILIIKALANFWKAEEKKVIVTTSGLREISGTAGSNLFTENPLTSDRLKISGSAGSNLHLNFDGQSLEIFASSGSNIFAEGFTLELKIKASSGSNIKAGKINTSKCEAKVSSGGNAWITVKNELTAAASSGGNIFYSGSPPLLNTSSSSGGNIIKRNAGSQQDNEKTVK